MRKTKDLREETIPVQGMHCQRCVNLIESNLRSQEGVETARVNLRENKVSVRFDPEEVSAEEIKNLITSLGYSCGDNDNKKKSFLQGAVYGLIPHTGCIAFVVASILGVTVAVDFFKPFLMNPYFFYILVAISLAFATLSSVLYLRKNGFLSLTGAKRKWKYLSIMYTSTVGVNVLFFLVLFPLLANVSASPAQVFTTGESSTLLLEVDIPCPGHAPLISEELKSLNGIIRIQFTSPNTFDVDYDPAKVTKEEILSLEVFKVYKATVKDSGTQNTQLVKSSGNCKGGGAGCCGGSR